ncbi:transcription factor IBH1 isoform X3 [Andrographis paniculata]|uniref:transcription factor IBH1 isoform X3 n=1 Tax=Andrographis paniculata TaxID=175694 RepID=UPI0021E834D8|nr:transcription factor IBH1 isoform X3 [Andrographis paniculata]
MEKRSAGTMKKKKKNPHTNPNFIKIRFAIKFLRAINRLNTTNTSRSVDKYRRYHTIRAAACASMASAVGPTRAWSRALLRTRSPHRFLANSRKIVAVAGGGNPRENHLRRLVPGGDAMDSCGLLKETVHYINCLRAQIVPRIEEVVSTQAQNCT